MDPVLPELPVHWPFPGRAALPPLAQWSGQDLPGLGAGWTLELPGGRPDQLGNPELVTGAFGRGGIRRMGEWAVRPYRRGGLVRHFNARRYPSPTRFAAEFRVHQALWEAGFPTVEPAGYGWRACSGWGVEGLYITRFEPGCSWPRDWSRSGEVFALLRPALEALCAWGLWAPDLNATNIHLQPGGGMLILDWDRATWMGAKPLLPKYRLRLLQSLQKLGAPEAVQQELSRVLC